MWNGTHTKACNLNGYESVMCLTVFAFPGLYVGFPVLWVLCYNYLVARIGFIRIPCFMIILSYLFISALTYLTPEYFLLDIICYMHYCAHPASPLGFASPLAWGVSFDSPGSTCPGHGARSVWSEWRSGSVDHQPTFQSHFLPGPLCASRVFSWVPFCLYLYCPCSFILFILVLSLYTCMWTPFCIVHICVYLLYSRICAYLWCYIIVIFITSGDNSVIVYICVGMYNAPFASVLWFLSVLMLSVYTGR